jgi:hypothetical protein
MMMKAKAVYDFLFNSQIIGNGMEVFPPSNEAVIVTELIDMRSKKVHDYCFHFEGLESTSQIVASDENLSKFDLLDQGLAHFLYVVELENGKKQFIAYNYAGLLLINATKVTLIENIPRGFM